jgi:hypothetical protein
MNTRTRIRQTVRTTRVETTTVTSYEDDRAERPHREGRGAQELRRIIEAGDLQPGELLVWERPRKKEIHYARVNADGTVTPVGTTRRLTLSAAAKFFAGSSHNGWERWLRARDGVRLDTLRARLDHH